MHRRRLGLLAACLLGSTGCAALISMAQHKASGPNPLGGKPIVNEWRQGLTPYVGCDPALPPSSATLSATPDEVCVATVDLVHTQAKHADVLESERPGGEDSLGQRRILVDGKPSAPFDMKLDAPAEMISRCQPSKPGAGSPAYYRLWRVVAKGCTPNGGLLTPASKEAALQREGAMAPYAVWSFESLNGTSVSSR